MSSLPSLVCPRHGMSKAVHCIEVVFMTTQRWDFQVFFPSERAPQENLNCTLVLTLLVVAYRLVAHYGFRVSSMTC